MGRMSKPDSERRSARLAPVPALSPAHRESVASVPVSCFCWLAHLVAKPKPGRGPVSFYRAGREIQRPRSFFDGEPAEKSQLDDATLLLIKSSQFVQRVVERDHVYAPRLER